MVEVVVLMDMMGGDDVLKLGEGLFKEERDVGYYDVLFIGESVDGKVIKVVVIGDKDFGYGLILKMIVESVVCFIDELVDKLGGVFLFGVIFGMLLIECLWKSVGMMFDLEF